MKLYDFLLSKMVSYANKIAFGNSKTTYGQLIKKISETSHKYVLKDKLIYTLAKSKEEQAIEILAILASDNVAVPLCDDYGKRQKEYIINLIKDDLHDYADLAFVIFTSGTTSMSKGVMLTNDNIINSLEGIDNYFKIDEDTQNILICRPLVHIASLVGELLYALYKGLTIYFYDGLFLPKKIDNYIIENNIHILGGTPTIFNSFLKACCSLKALKYGVISGEYLSATTCKKLADSYSNISFYHVYGMSENSSRIAALDSNLFNKYPSSVGKAIINTNIKLVDNEILIKSKSLMNGYYKNKNLTDKVFDNDGYFKTGDIGYINNEGYLFVLGRKDNMIIKHGLNIFPEEIENTVMQFNGVKKCLVYKIKKENNLEDIGLKVEGNIDKNELYRYLCHNLPSIQIPNEILIVDKIQTTPSGKIKR